MKEWCTLFANTTERVQFTIQRYIWPSIKTSLWHCTLRGGGIQQKSEQILSLQKGIGEFSASYQAPSTVNIPADGATTPF